MSLKPIKLAITAIFYFSFFSFSQVLPPGIANRNIHWPKDPPSGPQVEGTGVNKPDQTDQENSGEDWWYDVKPIYEGGTQIGYMTCGFTAYKNYHFNESNMIPQGFIRSPFVLSNPTDACSRRVASDEYVSQYQQHIGRYDLNGNPIWCKHINFGGPLMSLINTNDGGFIAVGETPAAYNMDNQPFIYNPSGIGDQSLTSLIDLNNPSLSYYETNRINVVKFDSDGNVVWNYLYGPADFDQSGTPLALINNATILHNQKLYGLDADISQDGTAYIIVGMSEDPISHLEQAVVFRLGLDGILVNKAILAPPPTDNFQLWIRGLDCKGGNCYIAGGLIGPGFSNISTTGTSPGFLLKFDDINLSMSTDWGPVWSASNPLRFSPFGTTSNILEDVKVDSFGNIVCTALKNSNNGYYSGVNYGMGTILKYNPLGNLIASEEFGEVRAFDMKIGLTKLASNDYVVVSSKRTKDGSNTDIIPVLSDPPFNTIIPDFIGQVDYPCTEGNMDKEIWNTDTYIAKFNPSLSLIWETQFDSDDKAPINHPGDFKKQECMYRIAEGQDGSLVAVGNSSHNIDDYLFVKVFSDCQSNINYDIDNITPIITQTWSTNKTVIGKVVIPWGQTLTISNCTIEFADSRRVNIDTKIVIEPGGRLIINNATLTSIQSCEKAMWDGIEVQGNPGLRQVPSSNQGYLSIRNNSIISNAREAISTTARNNDHTVNWTLTGGGIITATNSQFINNYASFGFMKYTPHTASGAITNDASGIMKCSFTTTDDFGDGGMTTKPYSQIVMWDTRNVRIQGNTFTNTRLTVPVIERGIGILSVDAAFVVKPACNGPVSYPAGCPASNEVKNEFHDLYTGIAISNVNNSSFTIDKAIFTNNLYGIRVEGSQFGDIIRSEFTIPYTVVPGESKYAFGIYADAASIVKIEANKFNGQYNSAGRSMGVFMNNADVSGGGVSNFYNDYTGLTVGTQEAGANLSLQIDCNRFYKLSNTTLADIHLADGLLAAQGECNTISQIPDAELPQANEFYGFCNNSTFNQLRNTSLIGFDYNSYSQTDVGFSGSCISSNVTGVQCNFNPTYIRSLACPSTITTIGGGAPQKSRIIKNKQAITQLKGLIDGGNSQNVLSLIANSTNPAQLKVQLSAIAPYLSEQSQIAIIGKTMPNAIKKQILEGNAPFKQNVRNDIVNSSMPNAVKNQLMAIAYGESPLEQIEKTIKHYENDQRLATNDLLKMYLDSNYTDSVSYALTERNTIERSKLLIPILLQQDQGAVSNHLMIVGNYADSILPTKLGEAQELKRFHDFYSSILNIVNRPGGYFNLTSDELQMLKVAANEEQSISPFARSILNFKDSKLPYVDAFDLDGNKSLSVQSKDEFWIPLEEEQSSILVYPNPSTGWFEIAFEEQNEANKTVEVYNLEGRLLYDGKSNEISLTLDLSQLLSGIYVLKVNAIQSGIENNYTERIVITK